MRRNLLLSLVFIVVLAAAGVGGNAIVGNTPALGLDLQGGISITKVPVGDFSQESLALTRERIDERVNALGIAETEVLLQGDTIVINLPGVRDQQQAIEDTNVTGQVYLRPVLQCFDAPLPTTEPSATTTTVAGATTSTTLTGATSTTVGGASPATTTAGPSSTATASSVASGSGGALSRPIAGSPDDTVGSTTSSTTSSTSSSTASSTTAPGVSSTTSADATTTTIAGPTTTTVAGSATTSPVVSDPTTAQLLPTARGGTCYVGPAGGSGEVFQDDADADILNGAWGVIVSLKGGAEGEAVWNQLASLCYSGGETCPTRQLAIELDGVIQSAPEVQQPTFSGEVSITNIPSERDARSLARVLRSGALPVRLENQAVQAVSPTLGKDSLDAAIVAGLVGIGLVLAFMLLYYRWLAIVAAAGLLISGALLWSIVCVLSARGNLALTLSGAAGIIVSIGVTIDSYVVFFERLKDEVRAGRTLRNSVQRGFQAAWRTILAADAVSLIGAVVLWYLSVGSVRGFALFLGLSTIIDMAVAWFFTRPVVLLLARSHWFRGRRVMGIAVTPRSERPGDVGPVSA